MVTTQTLRDYTKMKEQMQNSNETHSTKANRNI
jgi:hypothetical protein